MSINGYLEPISKFISIGAVFYSQMQDMCMEFVTESLEPGVCAIRLFCDRSKSIDIDVQRTLFRDQLPIDQEYDANSPPVADGSRNKTENAAFREFHAHISHEFGHLYIIRFLTT